MAATRREAACAVQGGLGALCGGRARGTQGGLGALGSKVKRREGAWGEAAGHARGSRGPKVYRGEPRPSESRLTRAVLRLVSAEASLVYPSRACGSPLSRTAQLSIHTYTLALLIPRRRSCQ